MHGKAFEKFLFLNSSIYKIFRFEDFETQVFDVDPMTKGLNTYEKYFGSCHPEFRLNF